VRIYLIYINKCYIIRATYGKEMHADLVGKPTQRRQSDDTGRETMTPWVGLIWLRVSINERLL